MASATRSVTIGFQGGQVLAVRMRESQLEKLQKALGGDDWYEIDSEAGPVRVALAQIVYVSADSDELRVGFG